MSSLLWKMLLSAGGGAAAPTTLILDQFTDTNGTALQSHTIAPTNTPATSWTVLTGSMDIQGNEANVVSSALYTCDPGVTADTVSASMKPVDETNSMSLCPKVTNNNNKWGVVIDPAANTFFIQEANGGIFTTRATTSVTIAAGVAYQVSSTVTGTSITATLDGGNALNYSSTFLAAETKAGLRLLVAGQRVDNFQVTTP